MKHVVIYVPGLGDNSVRARKLLVASWWLYGVRPVVHQMNWSDTQPFAQKFSALLTHIDHLATAGHRVSLVGESAGASAVINAFAARPETIHRVACICGKLGSPSNIHPSIYRHNPAFAESMQQLPASIADLGKEQLERIRSVHPLYDVTVPVHDTAIPGAESKTIPSFGHAASIALGDTLFGYMLVGFLKRK